MQTTAIRTVANPLPENEIILLTLLISKRYIPYTDLLKIFHYLYFSTIFISLFLHKSSLRQACRAAGPESGAARKSPVDAVFVRNALGYSGLCWRYNCLAEKVARCGLTGGPVAWRGLYGIPRHPVRPCRAIGCKQKGRPWRTRPVARRHVSAPRHQPASAPRHTLLAGLKAK